MVLRIVELFGSFPASNWSEAFAGDIQDAKHVRIASGYTSLRGARELIEILNPEMRVDVLLGLAGCEGPDTVCEFLKHPNITVRGSLLSDFHWKAASIQANARRVLYLGSANFTKKGLSGSGEIMLRMTGGALDANLWETFQADFDAFFAAGTTLSGEHLLQALESVEKAGDAARGAQADLEIAIEREIHKAKARAAITAQHVWLIEWNDVFSRADELAIEQALGACPAESWTRGEVQDEQARRLGVGDFILGYHRDETSFVLGEVERLEEVTLSRNRRVWLADIHQVVPPITGKDHPTEYAAIRKILAGVLGIDCKLPAERYTKVISFLQREGLLSGDDAV